MTTVRVAVVPHTHWDREWYASFETFRDRLVDLLDDLLDLLEADPGYRHFLLDGQLAVVDDYLAVRPGAEDRLRRLIGSGRIAIGPWYTLPDEFCVSGETLVRDLQLGLERAQRLGGAMAVGYLPDMFGHVAEMPQLLRLAGFDRAAVWRGVPSAVDRSTFWWSSPDGSTISTRYLWDGYGNGSSVADDAGALLSRLRGLITQLGPAVGGDLLFMNGTDHERPQRWLARVVADADALADDLDIRMVSLAEALGAGEGGVPADDGLPRWSGELRSGARANLLMGVLSNRVDIKQAAAAAERTLERLAEPICALWMAPGAWPATMFADAWLEVIRNAAHDSSCACSSDDVCAAVLARYRSARHTADALAGRGLAAVAALPATAGLLVVNPTARPRGGLIEVELPGEGPVEDGQLIEARLPVLDDRVLDTADALAWLQGWRSQQIGAHTFVERVDLDEDGGTVNLTLHVASRLSTNILVPAVREDVARRLTTGAGRELHVRVVQPASCRVLYQSEVVPGYGWARWEPGPSRVEPVGVDGTGPMMTNGLITVTVDTTTGTFGIDGTCGLGALMESGDHGDTYNYNPPDHDTVVTRPDALTVTTLEAGPVRGRVEIVAVYRWPEAVDDERHRRVGCVSTVVTTTLELRASESFVRVRTVWENRSRDHRVRALFPLPRPASESRAECAFAVVTRGLTAEGGPTERPLATFPSRRFVSAGGLTIVHDGLLEYELTGDGGLEMGADDGEATTLALTLLRATGMLSRVDHAYRPLPAGPPLPVTGAQVLGPVAAAYAVSVDPSIDPFAMADEVLLPLVCVHAPGGGPVTAGSGQALVVEGVEVSSIRRDDGPAAALIVRVHNPTDRSTVARLPGRRGWIVDLRGGPVSSFDEEVALGPWQIATLRVDHAADS